MKGYLALLVISRLLESATAFSAVETSSSLIPLRPETANNILRNLLTNDDDTTEHHSLVMLEGLVSRRRSIGKHLVFLDIIPMDLPKVDANNRTKKAVHDDVISTTVVQAVMRRDFWDNADDTNNTLCSYDVYQKIIQPGVHVKLTGHAGPSRNANAALLFIHKMRYSLANDDPRHLRNVLRYSIEGALDINQVVNALPCIGREELINMLGVGGQSDNSLEEMASEILGRFPTDYLSNPSKLVGSSNSLKRKLLPPAPLEYVNVHSFCTVQDDPSEEFASIADILQHQKQVNTQNLLTLNTTKQFTISGWVQSRRRYQESISVLELVDEFSSSAALQIQPYDDEDATARYSLLKESQRLYAVLHPDALHVDSDVDYTSIEVSEMYGNVLCPGARVMLKGFIASGSTDDVPVFWAKSCHLLRSSWRPSAVRLILDLLHEKKFAVDEAAAALNLAGGYSQAQDIAKGTTSATERQWMAAELIQSLQGENSRAGRITSLMVQSLNSFAYARNNYPIEMINIESELHWSPLSESEVSSGESRWQRVKKPQLKFMIDQIGAVLRSHPEYGQRTLKVVDIGGGKGLLSNVLAEMFGIDIVEVHVVDVSISATNNGMMKAKRRGLQNILFVAQDATKLDIRGVDVVVALHACGALSDVALGHAVRQGAGFVVCPCCFLSNSHLRVPVTDR
ncbi:hypothetical protein ACHAW5_005254 [Stephanodiscus triporus]|uniref:Methyltransferase domain-containing protein n=1 Tax=Stephanodiscus triporus TaxID=2934178 RepID=A0ABD3MWB9_9STRA